MKALLTFGALTVAALSQAQIITQWNFNGADANNIPGGTASPTPAIGLGTASLLGGATATFASGNSNGGSTDPVADATDFAWNSSTYAAQSTENGQRGVRFNVSTVGFTGIMFSFDQRKSNTSSRYTRVDYTLDGTNFVSLATLDGSAGDTWFNSNNFDLSSVTGADNNANFGFRVVAVFDPTNPTAGVYAPSNSTSTYGTSSTIRYDMVTVSGAPVPEPATMVVLAGAGLAALARRKRN
jgi:hypothetical protein